jgi:Putative peptidoglycan binding domain
MDKTITDSVGVNGRNLGDDVRTIQTLLNNVLPAFGGPAVKLNVDGICGPKTKAAIYNFQLKQFGFKGADSRVDPGKQTLARLNLLAFGLIDPPVIPPGPGPSILEPTTRFVIHRMGSETSFGTKDEDLYFHFIDMDHGYIGIYWLKPDGVPMTHVPPNMTFHGPSRSFISKGPETVDRLDCEAVYFSSKNGPALTSHFVLNLPSGAIQIGPMPHHLIGPNGRIGLGSPEGGVSTWISGDLVFVRYG